MTRNLPSTPSYTFPPQSDDFFYNELVIVPGHSIYIGQNYDEESIKNDSNWFLLEYQKEQLPIYLDHIKSALEYTDNNPLAVVVFSGGSTRSQAGPRSEGLSYWLAAEAMKWLKLSWQRAIVEDHAKDSLENLMFSICRFKEYTGRYPEKITVFGFSFKSDRFTMLHRKALGIPMQKFNYVGLPTGWSIEKEDQVARGEMENSVRHFQQDIYGCGEFLRSKRVERNPFRVSHGYDASCPVMKGVLHACDGIGTVYPPKWPYHDS